MLKECRHYVYNIFQMIEKKKDLKVEIYTRCREIQMPLSLRAAACPRHPVSLSFFCSTNKVVQVILGQRLTEVSV